MLDSSSSSWCSWRSHAAGLKHELGQYRHSGISAEKFLQCTFGVSDEEMQKLKNSIEEDSVHNSSEYSAAREEFKRKAHLLQDDANVSFSNLANITLRYYRRESIHDLNVLPMSGQIGRAHV